MSDDLTVPMPGDTTPMLDQILAEVRAGREEIQLLLVSTSRIERRMDALERSTGAMHRDLLDRWLRIDERVTALEEPRS